jgi:protein TonB
MQIPWQTPDQPLDPHLAVALLASAVLHVAVLLALGFSASPPPEPSGPVLHMVEYQPRPAAADAAPAPEAKAASQSQQASGTAEQNREATSPDASRKEATRTRPSPAATPSPTQRPSEPRPQPEPDPAPEAASSAPTLTAPASPRQAPEPDPSPSRARPEAARTAPGSFQLYPSNREVARWDQQRRERSVAAEEARARKARAATREDVAATYINSFLGKVQRIGNLNYPEEARERDITGRVRVEVMVRPDGSLQEVRVLRSSGSDILDAAAQQIVRMGAPYSPFPPELEARYGDGLPIRHYFNFTRSAEMVSGGGTGS